MGRGSLRFVLLRLKLTFDDRMSLVIKIQLFFFILRYLLMSSLNIGITFNNTVSLAQAIGSNGIAQNVKFFYDLLLKIGHKPYLLVPQPVEGKRIEMAGKAYKAYTMKQVVSSKEPTHLLCEIAVSVHENDRRILREHFGAKVVAIKYGHSMYMDMEEMCYAPGRMKGQLYNSKPDEVWASPHFTKAFSYWETIFDAPVKICPFIWEPDFLSGEPEMIRKKRPNVYVMEPNISVLKNALIPMAIIEDMYRKAPETFEAAFIVNGRHFNEQPYFLDSIVRNFSCFLADAKKAFFTPRAPFADVFKERDVLIGHQMGCELNYLYMEALYRNIPLVHNSPAYRDVGYYYEDCEVFEGQKQLKAAIADENPEDTYRSNLAFLKQYSISSKKVQDAYISMINSVITADS